MATIVKPNTFTAGATIIAAEHNSNFDTIYNDYNGNITNANVASAAAIVDTKLAQLTTSNKVAESAIANYPFVTGDWVITSVTTARTGWTNVSATHSDRFMRVNATPLTTGGTDTHTHTAGSYAGPSHTHTVPASSTGWGTGAATAGKLTTGQDGGNSATTDRATAAGGTGAVTGSSASSNNIPAFVQVVIFQKD